MKIIKLLFLLLIGLKSACVAQQQFIKTKNILHGDTLIIGNAYIHLYYSVKDGIKLAGYKRNNKDIIYFHTPLPVLRLVKDQHHIKIIGLKEAEKETFPGGIRYKKISLHYQFGHLEIKKIWNVYPNIPVVSSYYYIRGKANNKFNFKPATSTTLIENKTLLGNSENMISMFNLPLQPDHWSANVVLFKDQTDYNNNLVFKKNILPYLKPSLLKGSLLLLKNKITNTGIFILKESPLPESQQAYPGFDFYIDNKQVSVTGLGIRPKDIQPDEWQRTYGFAIGFTDAIAFHQLSALHQYQKDISKSKLSNSKMIMSNTWGDRSRDSRMNERFVVKELEACAKLGITCFQLDDGWQQGISRNSAQGKNGKWNNWQSNDWQPNKSRFPNGFKPIIEKAKALGIKLGLWFNPSSSNNYQNWLRDAKTLVSYYRNDGIQVFKIDGIDIKNKDGERNLRKFFNYIMEKTDNNVMFNVDVTAGHRGGYFYLNKYGNIFLENRYTDWANYYPYHTLRNLWQLSRYIPAEKLQIEWLNTWRNADKYPDDDPLAPSRIPWQYQMAVTFMAEPLAWMEVSNLPAIAFQSGKTLKKYGALQMDIHHGTILPIGKKPDGFSWTGFQSLQKKRGYFLVFREKNADSTAKIKTWLPAHQPVKLKKILGEGKSFTTTTNSLSQIQFQLPSTFSYALFSYEFIETK